MVLDDEENVSRIKKRVIIQKKKSSKNGRMIGIVVAVEGIVV